MPSVRVLRLKAFVERALGRQGISFNDGIATRPSDALVAANFMATQQTVLTLSWAAAVAIPLVWSVYASVVAICLWAVASAAVFTSLAACARLQSCGSKAIGGPGTGEWGTVVHDTKPQPSETPPATPAAPSYSLVAKNSPSRASPEASAIDVSPQLTARDCASADDCHRATFVADAPPSPTCALLAAVVASANTSCAASAADSATSVAAPPAAMFDSVSAVAALRPSNLRYRSPFSASSGTGAVATRGCCGIGDLCRSLPQVHIKISHMDPRELRPNLISSINESLRACDSGLQVVGAYVRRGCVELTLDLIDCNTASALGSGAAAVPNTVSGPATGAVTAACPLGGVDLLSLVLSALRLPPPPPPAAGADTYGGPQQTIAFQSGGSCWCIAWNADGQRWKLLDEEEGATGWDTGDGGTDVNSVLALSAPLAMHAPSQLAAGAAAAGRGAVQLVVGLCPEAASDAASITAGDISALRVIAKANGRTVDVSMAPATCQLVGEEPSSSACCSSSSPPVPMVLELDLARLAAGRPAGSPGLVVRLELWRGHRVLDCASVACLADGAAVLELLAVQCELSAAGRLDPEDEAFATPRQQHAEAQQLLGDLAAWLDFVAAAAEEPPPPAAVVEPQQQKQQQQCDSLDVSDQVAALLRAPGMRRMMLGAGQHLLRYFVYHGHLALARVVRADLAPRLAAAKAEGEDLEEDEDGEGLPLLHRAVCSGSRAMVEEVLTWLYGGSGCTTASAAVWDTRGPGGLTALHLLAANAWYGGSGGGGGGGFPAATATSAAEAAEAMLQWILATWPAAVTVWNTERDASGNTPAMLWAALGGHDVQVAAAAAVLAREVSAVTAGSAPAEAEGGVREEQQEEGDQVAPADSPPKSRPTAEAAAAASRAPARFFRDGGSAAAPWGTDNRNSSSNRGDSSGGGAGQQSGSVSRQRGDATSAKTAAGRSVQQVQQVEEQRQQLQRGPRAAGVTAPVPFGWLGMLWLSLRGFAAPSLEREYVRYVTRSTSSSVLIWLSIMVVAHVTAAFKSPGVESLQAVIGGAAYGVSLAVMALRPGAYAAAREPLMLGCLLGRSLCRLLMTLLPDVLQMSESVQKYVFYGVDVLLDGLMEGTFEQVRVHQALVARLLVEWPILAGFIRFLGVRRTCCAALLRAFAVSGAGLAMSVVTDMRSRSMFLRELRRSEGQEKQKSS